ncbi:hypothetical protein GIB67_004478 [Kingdonia uniflora]|uniref:Tryptophan synthase beta chain-like PALP domain-containing protein n=1 Tax=Kingdonia uniflora TaxID=39325 RepID=A0A7J7MRZ3_9MAGN|nr:hypothetical protein GIB67_004478 [Kingdonia uniflora]
MKLHHFPRNTPLITMKKELRCRASLNNLRDKGVSELRECSNKNFVSELLNRRWTLVNPDTKIHQIKIAKLECEGGEPGIGFSFCNNSQPVLGEDMIMEGKREEEPSFYVARDDLLHPLVNGNKARKLDGLIPLLEDHSATDVRGLSSHLLLRGEQPNIPTGYNLISTMFGNTVYVPRSLYAKREEMLSRHAHIVAGDNGCVIEFNDILNASFPTRRSEEIAIKSRAEKHRKRVVIINEGAGDAAALLGLIRLVNYLSQSHLFGKEKLLRIIVDSGTGTTAVGLRLGALCLGLPWEVTGVMLADTIEGYKKHEKHLISDFKKLFGSQYADHALNQVDSDIVHWVERKQPRKFGNVLNGEIDSCQQIAKQTGILVDPIYTLSAWEYATQLCQSENLGDTKILMLHTGGTLGMFGLAQRYESFFHKLKTPLHISLQH